MNISPIISYKPQIQAYKNQKSLNFNRNIANDSVSFTSISKLNSQINSIIDNSCAFGMNVYAKLKTKELNLDELTKLARNFISEVPELAEKYPNMKIPELYIDTMNNLPKEIINSRKLDLLAYLLPSYGENCKLNNVTLFIPNKRMSPKTIGSLVHEYTHTIQRMKDNSYLGLADITGRDLEKTRALNAFCTDVFARIESLKGDGDFVSSMIQCQKAGLPDENAMSLALGYRNVDDAKMFFQNVIFNNCFEETRGCFLQDPEIFDYIPLINKPSKIKKIAKQQCKLRANMEFEAYSAQKKFLNRTCGCKEVDAFNPTFYKMMYKLLD